MAVAPPADDDSQRAHACACATMDVCAGPEWNSAQALAAEGCSSDTSRASDPMYASSDSAVFRSLDGMEGVDEPRVPRASDPMYASSDSGVFRSLDGMEGVDEPRLRLPAAEEAGGRGRGITEHTFDAAYRGDSATSFGQQMGSSGGGRDTPPLLRWGAYAARIHEDAFAQEGLGHEDTDGGGALAEAMPAQFGPGTRTTGIGALVAACHDSCFDGDDMTPRGYYTSFPAFEDFATHTAAVNGSGPVFSAEGVSYVDDTSLVARLDHGVSYLLDSIHHSPSEWAHVIEGGRDQADPAAEEQYDDLDGASWAI